MFLLVLIPAAALTLTLLVSTVRHSFASFLQEQEAALDRRQKHNLRRANELAANIAKIEKMLNA